MMKTAGKYLKNIFALLGVLCLVIANTTAAGDQKWILLFSAGLFLFMISSVFHKVRVEEKQSWIQVLQRNYRHYLQPAMFVAVAGIVLNLLKAESLYPSAFLKTVSTSFGALFNPMNAEAPYKNLSVVFVLIAMFGWSVILDLCFRLKDIDRSEDSGDGKIIPLIMNVLSLPAESPVLALSALGLDGIFQGTWYRWNHPFIARFFFDCLFMLLLAVAVYQITGRRAKENSQGTNRGYLVSLNEELKLFKANHGKLMEAVFLFSFTVLYVNRFIETTMVSYEAFSDILALVMGKLQLVAVLHIAVIAIIETAGTDSRKRFLTYLGLLCVGAAATGHSAPDTVLEFMLLVVAATDRDVRKILWISLLAGVGIMILAWWLSVNGYIYYFVYSDGGHAMGIIYKTDCSAHWYFMMTIYVLLRKGKFWLPEYSVLSFLTYYVYHITMGLAGFVCMSLLLILLFVRQYIVIPLFNQNNKFTISAKRIINRFITVLNSSFLISCGGSLFATIFLTEQLKWMNGGKLSTIYARLTLGFQALQTYAIRMLSQNIPEQGAGRVVPVGSTYFYLDNSYIRILMIGGILLLVAMMAYLTEMMKKSAARNRILWIVLGTIAVHSMIEHHLMHYCYSVVLLLGFADWEKLNPHTNNEEI